MSDYDEFAALNLSRSVHAQALKLLAGIAQASTLADTLHAADRAEGFTLDIETVKALNLGAIEGLYLVFDRALQTRQRN
ncbi:hypothetical protein [Pseudomonas mercuritolerans]|uniref:Uncharacterized protein n=1 Tax=Pseudomonas mercuritolerans TaxID=2951809 RepID=A0ABT2XPH6_9PSED|nr:hypothetical protein [Pseudomonas mercuritolerans]MCV2220605.1 hypothetical protein [Pseudomonas mercuritolerans]